jgi:hypothetical protein
MPKTWNVKKTYKWIKHYVLHQATIKYSILIKLYLFTIQVTISNNIKTKQIWAASWQNQHSEFATIMDPDQPAHPRSLIRIHAVRFHFSTCNRVGKGTAWILIRLRRCAGWSGSMLVANPFCWFCRDAAQIMMLHLTIQISTYKKAKFYNCYFLPLSCLHEIKVLILINFN